MEDNLSEDLRKAIILKNTSGRLCECGAKMEYNPIKGVYKCTSCGSEEQDMYGFLKEVLDKYPMLNKYDLSDLLGVPLRVLNEYFKNGRLVNPNSTI